MNAYLLKRLVLDIVYPNRCPFCDSYISFDEYFCSACRDKLSAPPEHEDIQNVDIFTAVTTYDDYSIPFIYKMKNESSGYALSAAAFMIFQSLLSLGSLSNIDFITYIPMRRKDINRRGYNQTKLIAKELAKLSGKPCKAFLKKTRDAKEQKTLSAKERRENMKDIFAACNIKSLYGRSVLIIDDVCTTGSTVSEAAKVLKESGAVFVAASVFAKTAMLT